MVDLSNSKSESHFQLTRFKKPKPLSLLKFNQNYSLARRSGFSVHTTVSVYMYANTILCMKTLLKLKGSQ